TAFFRELRQPAAVKSSGVGKASEDYIPPVHVVVLRGLDRSDQIADAGNANLRQLVNKLLADDMIQMRLTSRLVEQPKERHALFIIDRGDHVGISNIVHPRHVLVADAFDTVSAKSQLVQRWTLQCLGRDDTERRMNRPQKIARRDSACATCCGNV